jgi:SAM-dependent methyltransferase
LVSTSSLPPAQPWHRRLVARAPRPLRRLVLRFEVRIEESLEAFGRELSPGSRVLDAGAGECQYRHLFGHCRYVGVDLGVGDATWNYSRLDALADLGRLPFRSGTFDAALNVVVLEHTREPAQVVAELARVLKPGARLLLIAPQDWAMHQRPHDYFRYTRYGLEWLLQRAGLSVVTIEPVGGFFTLLGRRALDAALFFQGGWRWILFPLVAALAGPAGLLLPCLDVLDRERNTTLGYVCLATKAR